MKVVVDTNVLVSGMLSRRGPPAKIVDAISDGYLRLCFDGRILAEYRRVFARKKSLFNDAAVARLIDDIEAAGYSITAAPIALELPDPSDKPFIEVAVAGRVDYLITGNLKDFPEQATHQERQER